MIYVVMFFIHCSAISFQYGYGNNRKLSVHNININISVGLYMKAVNGIGFIICLYFTKPFISRFLIILDECSRLGVIPRKYQILQLSRNFVDYHVISLLNSSLEIQKAELGAGGERIHFLALILSRSKGPFMLPLSLSFYPQIQHNDNCCSKHQHLGKITLTPKYCNHVSLRHVVRFLCLSTERIYILKLEQTGLNYCSTSAM